MNGLSLDIFTMQDMNLAVSPEKPTCASAVKQLG